MNTKYDAVHLAGIWRTVGSATNHGNGGANGSLCPDFSGRASDRDLLLRGRCSEDDDGAVAVGSNERDAR